MFYVNVDDLENLARGTDCYYPMLGLIENEFAEKISITRCINCIYSSPISLGDITNRYVHCRALGENVPNNWFCASGTDGHNG